MNPNDFRRIDLACETDGTHPALETVYLHEGHLYAADGYIAVRLPVSPEEGDRDGLLPRRAVKIARMARKRLVAGTELVTVHFGSHDAVFQRPQVEEHHKNALGIYNSPKVLNRPGAHPDTHNPHFVIDARLLWRLAKTICERGSIEGYGLKVYLGNGADVPILVQPCSESDVLGAVMPMARVKADDMSKDKLDLWRTLGKLKEAICNEADKVELSGELLEELRKLL